MKRTLIVVCVFFAVSPSASAEPAGKWCVPKPKSPALECRGKGGKWKNGMCFVVKTKIKTQYKMKIETRTQTVIVKEPTIKIINVPAYQPSQSVSVNQEQKLIQAASVQSVNGVIKKKKADYKWWWMGPGIFVLGTWAGEKDFIVGGLGKLVFAVNRRFRVAGLIGAGLGPWQESKPNLLIGAEGSIRLWRWLFLNAGLETVWGGFRGLSVHRRIIFAGLGPDFWIGERADISLHFVFGTRDDVYSCGTDLGKFTAGNMLQMNLYF